MSSEIFVNRAASTLVSGINSSVTSLSVTSATPFPTSGNFRILITDELMLVTAVSGTTFTVTRGAEGTTAASHSSGDALTAVLTKGALDSRLSSNILTESYLDVNPLTDLVTAFSPSSSNPGRVILNKSGYLYYDNGTTFDVWGGLQPIFNNTSLTHITGATAPNKLYYINDTGTYLQDANPSTNADRYVFYSMPFVSPLGHIPWIIGKFSLLRTDFTATSGTYFSTGLVVLDSTNNTRVIFEIKFDTGIYYLSVKNILADGSIGVTSTFYSFIFPIDVNSLKWIGMRCDAPSNEIKFYHSYDGVTPNLLWTITDTGWVPSTMDHYGIFINAHPSVTYITSIIPYLNAGDVSDPPLF